VLGDTTLGVKGFTPAGTLGAFSAGGEVQLLLLNGSGDVGVAGGATSAMFRALGTADLRQLKSPLPLRFNVNLGYKVDNSAAAVEDVEAARKRPISRIERFGLGISKVDAFQTALSAEAVFPFVQPFLEYSVDVPVNRQGYECFTNTVSRGDVCLGLSDLSDPNGSGIGYAGVPSRLGLGARVTPFQAIESASGFRGLSASLGVEIGLSGTSTFVEEVTPQAPWTLYFGLGYAYDSKERPVVQAAPAPPVEKIVEVAAPQSLVRGIVRESGKSSQPVAGAILSFQGGGQPPLATGADGRFLSRHLEPGTYTFEIAAPGYKPGTCTATVNAPAPAALPPAAAPAQPMFPGAPQMPVPPAAPAPAAPKGPSYTDIECQLEAKPRLSTLSGSVKDAASGTPVANASILVTDAQGKELKVMSDASGNFKVEGLAPGELAIRGEANGYMPHAQSADGRAGEESRTTVGLNKRPKNPLVKIQGSEIKLSDKIQFETDSAKIVGQSTPLLEEIADVLQKNPDLADVEIQGHTDNSGSRDGNQRLSDARANAVRDWLVKAGVAGGRLKAKGYGQDRPLAPNVTEANRAKNRRVQFIINKK
jgi:outer membrane protein OmpA-like peptidoglycan-associated protein